MTKAELEQPGEAQAAPGWRFKVGFVLFIGDLILEFGMFLLGGDFWDKLRSLFIHNESGTI